MKPTLTCGGTDTWLFASGLEQKFHSGSFMLDVSAYSPRQLIYDKYDSESYPIVIVLKTRDLEDVQGVEGKVEASSQCEITYATLVPLKTKFGASVIKQKLQVSTMCTTYRCR